MVLAIGLDVVQQKRLLEGGGLIINAVLHRYVFFYQVDYRMEHGVPLSVVSKNEDGQEE